jgi:hypothetical protein
MLLFASEWIIDMMQEDRKGFNHSEDLLLQQSEPFSFCQHLMCNKEKVTD